ncbi:uro-adherence factor A-like isoform X2 [Euwallacea fornicatus]|uniref:uro-adherence factor A-like isoform X2 n=1 Tax=Euwallacea fornicatus TaxID=995702 RepID=UPI00338F7036
MDQNKYHESVEESLQLLLTEDEQRTPEDHSSLESYPSSNDKSADLSQESSEYSQRTQLHPRSDLSIGTSSRVLYDGNVEILPEGPSHETTIGASQDIDVFRENLYSSTENVVESEIPSQDVGASTLERQISTELLRDSIAASEQRLGPFSEAPDQAGPSGRSADHLQEFITKYSAVFHTIISDFSNFEKIVRLFTDNPKILLEIVQIFIDNPEVLRSTSQNAELSLPQPNQLSPNQHGSTRGLPGSSEGLDRNPKNTGEPTMPNPSQSSSSDLGRIGGHLKAHIDLLTKFDELKEILLHLEGRNDQGGNEKFGPARNILDVGNSALANQISCSRPLGDISPSENESTLLTKKSQSKIMEHIRKSTVQVHAVLERSDQSEIEPPSQKGEGPCQKPEPRSNRPLECRKQSLEEKSNLLATRDNNSLAGENLQQSQLEFPSQEVGKPSELQELVPSGGHGEQMSEVRGDLPTALHENVEPHFIDRNPTEDSAPEQKSHSREGVIKWFFKSTEGKSSDVNIDSSISEHSASKDGKSEGTIDKVKKHPQDHCYLDFNQSEHNRPFSDSRKHSVALQRSDESEIKTPSREVENFTEGSQPGPSRKALDHQKQSLQDRQTLLIAPDPNVEEHVTDHYLTKNSGTIQKSQKSGSDFLPQEVEKLSEKQLEPNRGVIKWFSKSTDSKSSGVPSGSSSRECHASKDNREHTAPLKRSHESEIGSLARKVEESREEPPLGCKTRPSDDRIRSSENRSVFPAKPDENVEQHHVDRYFTRDSASRQKSRESESEFPSHGVEKTSENKQPECSERSLPSQFRDLVTDEVVKWFFKLTDTTISVVDCNSSCSEQPDRKDVKSPRDTHKHKKDPRGPCHLAFDQPGPSTRLLDSREPAAVLDKSSQSEHDFPSRKVGEFSEEPHLRPSRRPSDHRKQDSADISIFPAIPDQNVELMRADHYSTEDSSARTKLRQSELKFSLQEIKESSEGQSRRSSEGRPCSPSTDLLTDEVVKWFFQLNESIKSIIHDDSSSSECPAREDIKSSGQTHKYNEEPQGTGHLALDQPGPSTRLSEISQRAANLVASGELQIEFLPHKLEDSSKEPQPGPSRKPPEHREHISKGRRGLQKTPDENDELHRADFYSPKDSTVTKKSDKTISEFAPKDIEKWSKEQQLGSKEGRLFLPSTDLLIEVINESDRPIGKDFKGVASDQGPPPPTPEKKPSPQLLNVGNVNELLGHLGAPPISTPPCDVCHLHPMQFDELNFWYQLHWKLIIDGRERDFESQAKPIVLVNSNEADQYFQEIESRMTNPGDEADRAYQKQYRNKKGRKEKKRNF